jgi:type I restriction enzyme S subunit
MDEATANLFPDDFEESELGLVPKGWAVKKFGDFIDRQSVGKKFDQKTAFANGQVPILDQGKSGIIGFHNEEPSIKASLENPVVVFANHTCYMRLICFDFSAIQNVLPFIGMGVDTVWAFYATKDRIKFSEYKGHWPDFAIEKAVVPSVECTNVFRCFVDPLVARIRNNELQIQNLATLRDTLLPRLISGQLRIADADPQLNKEINS